MTFLSTRPRNVTPVDMTGQVIGRWEVLGSSVSLGRGARWRCKCVDCGATMVALGTALRRERVACPVCRAMEATP